VDGADAPAHGVGVPSWMTVERTKTLIMSAAPMTTRIATDSA